MKNILGKAILLASALLFSITGTSCSNDDNATPEKEKTYDMSGFAKGADVSWLTEMEKDGVKFYNQNGKATECMKLLREEGTNSIRLRVWVNPEGGWCGKNDVIAKAWRAQQLGFRLMIDFHYSDTWADPGNQKVPAAWQGYTAEQMKQAVADHTKDVLNALKERGVNVEWVQVHIV
jgi:arabinogalactan endo-1,4-beta-galactosidase